MTKNKTVLRFTGGALFVALFIFCDSVRAQKGSTIVQERLGAQKRLVPLKKLTVGPFNNYHADVVPDRDWLFHTRKIDLSPYVFALDLQTGQSRHFFGEQEDAEQPVVSPGGKKLAFTYYRRRSFGEICYVLLPENWSIGALEKIVERVQCLDGARQTLSAPFWLGEDLLGYLRTEPVTQRSQVVVKSLDGAGAEQVLAEGNLTAPSASRSGRYLVYTLVEGRQRQIVIKDLQQKRERRPQIELPGLSGLPVVSGDDRYVYFSQYLNDTNGDQIIDASDHSVIFRLPLAEVFQKSRLFPEQLTSVENNCSFPRPRGDTLYMTCAYQGSLDVYSLPSSGSVPPHWQEKDLWSAHQTARTYDERILLLNAIKYRHPQSRDRKVSLRLLSNAYHAEHWTAALYYLAELMAATPGREVAPYRALGLLLRARRDQSQLLSGEITREFRQKVVGWIRQLNEITRLSVSWRQVVGGQLNTMIGRDSAAVALWRQARIDENADPLLLHLYWQLAQRLRETKKISFSLQRTAYLRIFAGRKVPPEVQAFVAIQLLREIEKQASSLPQRLRWLQESQQKMKGAMEKTLFSVEEKALTLTLKPSEQEKQALYREIDKVIRDTREQYFLQRAIYTRTVAAFAEAKEFRYLNLIANNWLRFTPRASTEFAHAREHLVYAVRDRAYASWHQGKLVHANNLFLQSLSLTDDLESHYGYIKVMLQEKKKQRLQEKYQDLRKRRFIDDHFSFVEAVLLVMEDRERRAQGQDLKSTELLEQAKAKIEEMSSGWDSAVRALFLGYVLSEQYERRSKGHDGDIELAEEVHRQWMLANDLGKDNERIRASALMNLGWWHLRTQSYRSAVRFLELRGKLPFVDADEEAGHRFLLARAYYYSRRPWKGSQLLDQWLKNEKPANGLSLTPFLERRAFYAMAAGRFKESREHYQTLLESGASLSDLNRAKALLGHGYSLLKSGEKESSGKALRQGWSLLNELSARPASRWQALNFEPLKMKLHFSGLLARAFRDDRGERFRWLEQRKKLLGEAQSKLNELNLKEAEWFSHKIRNSLQLAEWHAEGGEQKQAWKQMDDALKKMQELGEENDLWLGEVFYQTSRSSLSYLLAQKADGNYEKTLSRLEPVLKAYQQLSAPSEEAAYQLAEIHVLMSAARKSLQQEHSSRQEIWSQQGVQRWKDRWQSGRWQALSQLAQDLQL